MAQSSREALGMNFLALCSENVTQVEERKVHPNFIASSWYKDIIYVLQKLQAPLELRKNRARSIKLKAEKFCIIDKYLFSKDPGGVLLKFSLEEEAKEKMQEFHIGDCGNYLDWKKTTCKIIRVGFYCPTLF